MKLYRGAEKYESANSCSQQLAKAAVPLLELRRDAVEHFVGRVTRRMSTNFGSTILPYKLVSLGMILKRTNNIVAFSLYV